MKVGCKKNVQSVNKCAKSYLMIYFLMCIYSADTEAKNKM